MRTFFLVTSFNANVRKCLFSTTPSVRFSNKSDKSRNTTVDVGDVQHHGNLSEKWWDVRGKLKGLHAMNALRVHFVRDGLANMGVTDANPSLPLNKLKILDVGCGGGILSEPLARIGADVTGIDASATLIKTATEHAALDSNLSERLRYINTTIEEHSEYSAENYDAVVGSEILEHVSDQELFLKHCAASTKPGGSIFLTTLNKTMLSWLGGIIVAEYILKFAPLGTHDWNKFISPNETRRLLESYGCQTKLIHGMFYNPLRNEWSWISSTAICYALHAVKKT